MIWVTVAESFLVGLFIGLAWGMFRMASLITKWRREGEAKFEAELADLIERKTL